ncbi:MAG TPA: flagellar hook-associated protein FlgK [Gaiellaceae bacterium]|jgi:flagellar hook-associated protein 1 FlgK
MSVSTFLGIETTLRGLLAQQRSLDVTGHNISNANTVGYSRQEADLTTSTPLTVAPGKLLGTGVDVVSYKRIRDSFLDVQLRAQTMLKGSADAKQDGLDQVEGVLSEPSDTGLSSLLNKYWAAWQTVSSGTEDPATRTALVEAAKGLTDGLNNLSRQLSTIQDQTAQNAQLTVDDINATGKQIRDLNDAIYKANAMGETPNDLLDQRDLLLDKLGTLGSVATTDNGDGTIKVTFDGVTLVQDHITAQTLTESGGTLTNDAVPPESATIDPAFGKLGALVQLRDVTLSNTNPQGYGYQLNQVASALITQTNALHRTGYGLDGSTGVDFFSGTDASNIGVSVQPMQVAAASAPGKTGDVTNAIALANLQTTAVASLGGSTIDRAYAQLVTRIGSDSQDATRSASNASVLVDSLTNRRESVSGVSIDEEMTNLVKFQRAYQASARAMNAMDDMLELLITRTGRAGL